MVHPEIQSEIQLVDEELICFGCGYNLNTMPILGDCPECGFSVAETIERRGRQYVLSFADLGLGVKCFYIFWGIVIPVFSLGMYLLLGLRAPYTDFKRHADWHELLGFALFGFNALILSPLFIWAMMAIGFLCAVPYDSIRKPWIRVGLLNGVVISSLWGVLFAIMINEATPTTLIMVCYGILYLVIITYYRMGRSQYGKFGPSFFARHIGGMGIFTGICLILICMLVGIGISIVGWPIWMAWVCGLAWIRSHAEYQIAGNQEEDALIPRNIVIYWVAAFMGLWLLNVALAYIRYTMLG